MFKEKTLLVVGAGASSEIGMPLGSQLSDIIYAKSKFKFDFDRLIEGDKFLYYYLRKKYSDIKDSNLRLNAFARIREGIYLANSIDNFIDIHSDDPTIAEVGKLAIAVSIAQAEANSHLFVKQNDGKKLDLRSNGVHNSWLDLFARILIEKTRKDKIDEIKNNISIICFNYDRCIEHYLIEAISQTFCINYNEAHQIVENMDIIHPYGTLGNLPGTQSIKGTDVAFGYNIESGLDPWPLADRIKTYTEQINDQEILIKIRSAVRSASQIMFLGFAFHPQNMALLRAPSSGRGKRVFATGKGISPQENSEVTKRILSLFADPADLGDAAERHTIFIEHEKSCRDLFEIHGRNVSSS